MFAYSRTNIKHYYKLKLLLQLDIDQFIYFIFSFLSVREGKGETYCLNSFLLRKKYILFQIGSKKLFDFLKMKGGGQHGGKKCSCLLVIKKLGFFLYLRNNRNGLSNEDEWTVPYENRSIVHREYETSKDVTNTIRLQKPRKYRRNHDFEND